MGDLKISHEILLSRQQKYNIIIFNDFFFVFFYSPYYLISRLSARPEEKQRRQERRRNGVIDPWVRGAPSTVPGSCYRWAPDRGSNARKHTTVARIRRRRGPVDRATAARDSHDPLSRHTRRELLSVPVRTGHTEPERNISSTVFWFIFFPPISILYLAAVRIFFFFYRSCTSLPFDVNNTGSVSRRLIVAVGSCCFSFHSLFLSLPSVPLSRRNGTTIGFSRVHR